LKAQMANLQLKTSLIRVVALMHPRQPLLRPQPMMPVTAMMLVTATMPETPKKSNS